MLIDAKLVEKLIKNQFPDWCNLPIKPMEKGGNDNRMFHLGKDMLVRLPSAKEYASQPEKEFEWLPKLGKQISLPIPMPVAIGRPDVEYPFSWLITRYIQGETVTRDRIVNMEKFVSELAYFLNELQSADTKNAPTAGAHNFYRGGNLSVYDGETSRAIEGLNGEFPSDKLSKIWNIAITSKWERDNVWVHGDVAIDNLLLNQGELGAVIDFGCSAVGDPACDYVMAWTFFDVASRNTFFELLDCDKDTIDRARGWALWKALITYDTALSKHVINEILKEEVNSNHFFTEPAS